MGIYEAGVMTATEEKKNAAVPPQESGAGHVIRPPRCGRQSLFEIRQTTMDYFNRIIFFIDTCVPDINR